MQFALPTTWTPSARTQYARPPAAIVYGPVRSRRLGRSLGVNLIPAGCRGCSFECVYCEFARKGQRAAADAPWPAPGAVFRALERAFRCCGPVDSITISGNGEPTLHPKFPEVADAILTASRRDRPGVPVRILTNGSGAVHAEIRRALDRLDERIVAVDADAERVDRPDPDSPLGSIVYGVSQLRELTVQACFIDGACSNLGADVVSAWADLVGELDPNAVQIYTINRRPAGGAARPASAADLEAIAGTLRRRTGIEAAVFA